MKIIAKSNKVPRSLVGFGKHISATDRKKVIDALIALKPDSDALKIAGSATKIEFIKPEHRAEIDKIQPLFLKVLPIVMHGK